jgi:acyl-coenzyme A synthetase/AMP-(fatty) acid ligase/acyl carrier protein
VNSVLHEFRARATEHPSLVAVSSPGGLTTSYSELASQVEESRKRLTSSGVGTGTVVRVSGRLDASMIAVVLAVWACKAIVWLVDEASVAPGTIIHQAPAFVDVRTGADTPEPLITAKDSYLDTDAAQALRDIGSRPSRGGDRPGYIVRSSGSMGHPKYILGSYWGLAEFIAWQRDRFGIGPSDSIAHVTNVAFDVIFRELLLPLVSGAQLLLPPRSVRPAQMLARLVNSRATVVHVVPSLARMWLNTARDTDLSGSCLRLSFFAGEPLDGALVANWRERMGSPDGVVNLYGPSETTLAKFHFVVPVAFGTAVCPVGSPLPGTAFSLLVPEGRRPVGPGEVGEVVIETAWPSFGYIGPGSAERNLAFEGDTRFRTGDLGRLKDGVLQLVGRTNSTMKVNGRWVDRAAIETVLRGIDEVTDAVVLPMRTPAGIRIRAFVSSPTGIDRKKLRAAISENLGSTSVPSTILEFPELPRLRNGKIALARLMNLTEEITKGEGMVNELADDQPTEPVLQFVMRSASLAIGRDVSADIDLFDFGLDSLGALEISAAIEEHYPLECSMVDVLEYPVVSELAQLLIQRGADKAVQR